MTLQQVHALRRSRRPRPPRSRRWTRRCQSPTVGTERCHGHEPVVPDEFDAASSVDRVEQSDPCRRGADRDRPSVRAQRQRPLTIELSKRAHHAPEVERDRRPGPARVEDGAVGEKLSHPGGPLATDPRRSGPGSGARSVRQVARPADRARRLPRIAMLSIGAAERRTAAPRRPALPTGRTRRPPPAPARPSVRMSSGCRSCTSNTSTAKSSHRSSNQKEGAGGRRDGETRAIGLNVGAR